MSDITRIRSKIPPPRGLTTRNKCIYTDAAGNKLFAKKGGGNTDAQFSAHNKQGRLVNAEGIKLLMRRWNRTRRK